MTQSGGEPSILIIGAGMSGLLAAIRLQREGFDNFRIYEKAADLGGTWRENTYPGIACDIASHYFTYRFEPNPTWSSRLPQGSEIQQYLQGVASKYDLRRRISFGREIVSARHDGDQWRVTTADGESTQVDVIVACCGLLHHPRYPDIPGLERFSGAAFHSARWDHDVVLDGRRVGIIGNGSTGVQIIASLAQRPLDLTVFQRSAQWIFPLPDRRYLKFERALAKRVPALARLTHEVYRIAFENLFAKAVIQPGWQRRLITWLTKWNLRRVKDPALRQKLTPSTVPLCRRLVMSTKFYPAMQRDNVALVTDDIDRVDPSGVVTKDGRLHEVDVLVLATGFDAHAYFRPIELENAQGLTIAQLWADAPVAHRTVAIPEFPNFFMTLGPQSPIGNFSAISIAETQVDYIMQCIGTLRRGKVRTLAPSQSATRAFNQKIRQAMPNTIWTAGCNSWYIPKNGVPSAWPFTGAEFRQELGTVKLSEFEDAS